MHSPFGLALAAAALITIGAASEAVAGGRFSQNGFHHGHGGRGGIAVLPGGLYGSGYGYADAAYGGYGAPIMRFPRPNEIVPPAWGYGTYGAPTMPGIRQAPAGDPTVVVIDEAGPAYGRRSPGAQIVTRSAGGRWLAEESVPGGPRIISVRVPRR